MMGKISLSNGWRGRLCVIGLLVVLPLGRSAYADPLAVVTNGGSNNVSVIDLATHQVIDTIPVGTAPVGIAADPVNQVAYVANSGSSSVTRIDFANNTQTTLSIPGSVPEGVAVTPDGSIVLLSSLERVMVGPGSQSRVYVIDAQTFTVNTPVFVEDDPEGLSISGDGDLAWIPSDRKIVEMDLTQNNFPLSNVISGVLDVDDFEHVVALRNRSTLFATNPGRSRIDVISLSTETIIGSVTPVSDPEDIALRPNSNEIHFTNQAGNSVGIFSASTFQFLATVNLSQVESRGLAFSLDGLVGYVVSAASDTVVRYDAVARTEINPPIAVGDFPEEIAIFDPVPSAPTGLSAIPGATEVLLDWDDNIEADLAGYNVYRATASGGHYDKLNTTLAPNSDFTDNTGLVIGTDYFYVVTAVDNAANESDNSSEVMATFTGVPAVVESWELY